MAILAVGSYDNMQCEREGCKNAAQAGDEFCFFHSERDAENRRAALNKKGWQSVSPRDKLTTMWGSVKSGK